MPSSSAVRSPPVRSLTAVGDLVDRAVSSSAPTITNRATKKNSVGHSIFDSACSSGDPGDQQRHRGAGQRDGRRLDVERLVGEEQRGS